MSSRPGYLIVCLLALTACGGAFEGEDANLVRTTDRYYEAELAEQRLTLEQAAPGAVVDTLEWVQDGQRVYSILSVRTGGATAQDSGVYLSHYRLGAGGARPLWTYVDELHCVSPGATGRLRHCATLPSAPAADGILLAYSLGCADSPDATVDRLVELDVSTGTPAAGLERSADRRSYSGAAARDPARRRALLARWPRHFGTTF